jgi:hypothetical protein
VGRSIRQIAANVDVSVDGEVNDPQYADLKGAWRDTLFVKNGDTAIVRSRYRRYIGDFVLHWGHRPTWTGSKSQMETADHRGAVQRQ